MVSPRPTAARYPERGGATFIREREPDQDPLEEIRAARGPVAQLLRQRERELAAEEETLP